MKVVSSESQRSDGFSAPHEDVLLLRCCNAIIAGRSSD